MAKGQKTERIELKIISNVPSHINLSPDELVDAEEGETVGPFKITEKEEIPCEHEDIRWDLDDRNSSEPPGISGKCMACDAVLRAEPGEVEIS